MMPKKPHAGSLLTDTDLSTQKQDTERNYFAVLSTMMLQNRRYGKNATNSVMTIAEYKVLMYLVSKIKPDTTELQPIELNIKDYYAAIGKSTNSGSAYQNMKTVLKKLSDRSEWIPDTKGGEFLGRWINKVQSEPRSGKFTIYLQDDMAPYLLNLKKQYTKFQNAVMFAMESRYSVQLYMLLKSYMIQTQEKLDFDTQDLKERLDAVHYKNFSDFKRKVLNPAIKELNLYTELQVEMATTSVSGTITQVHFTVTNLEKRKDDPGKKQFLGRLTAARNKLEAADADLSQEPECNVAPCSDASL